jgi:hypothetical protein
LPAFCGVTQFTSFGKTSFMKKIFTLLAITASLSASSQIKKGSLLLSGTVQASTSKKTETNNQTAKNNSILLSPSLSSFYADNRSFGINLLYQRVKPVDMQFTSRYYGAGLFLRQYFPLGKIFYLYSHEGLSVRGGRYKGYYQYTPPLLAKNKELNTSLNVQPGVACMLGKRLFLNLDLPELARMDFQHSSYEVEGNPSLNGKTNSFAISSSLAGTSLGNLGLGVSWVLR